VDRQAVREWVTFYDRVHCAIVVEHSGNVHVKACKEVVGMSEELDGTSSMQEGISTIHEG
jgi:hypothetical protein